MPLSLDPGVAAGIAPLIEMMGSFQPPAVGDWQTRRVNATAALEALKASRPEAPGVATEDHIVTAADGAELLARWFTPAGSRSQSPSSAVLYLHGGGMIMGSVDGYDPIVRRYVAATGVPMLAIEYRLAPEHPHPTPVEDCYAALVWLADHADRLDVDTKRIAVMGDSAGGGLAAGVALMSRDREGPALAKQILVYPMLDDRSVTPDPLLLPFLMWSYDDNVTGWDALLGAQRDDVKRIEYAAPSRADSLTDLPPAFIDIGALDLFREECVDYAQGLGAAGVPCELHLYAGCPHGFEVFAPDAEVSKRAIEQRHRVIREL